MSRWLQRTGVFVLVAIQFATLGFAAPPAASPPSSSPASDASPDFERDIRPILAEQCISCHGPAKQKNGLRLDAAAPALRGGDTGPAIVPGKSDQSELLRRITATAKDQRMPPPDKPPLAQNQIDLLRRWIDAGAPWPESPAQREAARDARLDHWAWQAVQPAPPPAVASPADASSIANPIDLFLLARLREKQLSYSPPADRRTLIRRLSFDLWGLPPSPADIAQFESDDDPLAYERLVDRMLASPRYGERMAQHWLDIAHYADTHGFERDQRRDSAFRYRDWVIQAFNSDLPYPQFLRDQVAGDVLRPSDPAAIAATGFLAAGPWDFVGLAETPSPVLKRAARADDLADMVTQVMTAACGVTIHCARCHDHKLDPIGQREYYGLVSVLAGLTRGDRPLDPAAEQQATKTRQQLQDRLQAAESRLRRIASPGLNLADVVAGGDGYGSGAAGMGLDPATGKAIKERRGFLEGAAANVFFRTGLPGIDGVFIPKGGKNGETPISSTGLAARDLPETSGRTWDAIRSGPVNSQFSTSLGGVDFAKDGHWLLSLHANAGITFDLAELRKRGLPAGDLRLRSFAGYFGQTPKSGANIHLLVDGKTVWERRGLGRDDGPIELNLPLAAQARFLTLISTDGGNDISHDQIGFGDIRLEAAAPPSAEEKARCDAELAVLTRDRDDLKRQLAALPEIQRVYSVKSEPPPPVHLLVRGNPEQPREAATPSAIQCLAGVSFRIPAGETSDAQRRIALADWLADPAHPLVGRVIVNRIWQQHFGVGLVDTPSDFGLGGGRPSHPQLLDWLANELHARGGSLKAMHRLICLSSAYRQQSLAANDRALLCDAQNRLLWRQTPRRLDAESMRDAILAATGSLQLPMYGPGFRDFDYQEEYAPVYTYITPDKPELWRRSIYRFVVRTTPHRFLTTLDCPNPANWTPKRSVTTTPLQSLALLNDEFMLRQAEHFAGHLTAQAGPSSAAAIRLAFRQTLARDPDPGELAAADKLVKSHGLAALCRFLLSANEFAVID